MLIILIFVERQKLPPNITREVWSNKLPQIAFRIDECLYKNITFEEYSRPITLKSRLKQLREDHQEKKRLSSSGGSSSSCSSNGSSSGGSSSSSSCSSDGSDDISALLYGLCLEEVQEEGIVTQTEDGLHQAEEREDGDDSDENGDY
jgi:hypothetical protein